MRIDLRSNIDEVLRFTDRFNSQYRFAVSVALNKSARAAVEAMPAQLERDLDNPTPFTKTGFYVKPSNKELLVAEVRAKDAQDEYLRWQVEGGVRVPKRKALRLPGDVELNAYGNMPSGLVRQLVARAKAGRRATKTQARRFGVSQQLSLFYGEPGDGRPAGIYKRVNIGTQHRLVPVVVFPKESATYRRRFDFEGAARKAIERTFEANLRAAWARALETAK